MQPSAPDAEAFVASLTLNPKFATMAEGPHALGFPMAAVWAHVKVLSKGLVAIFFKNEGLKNIAAAAEQIINARKMATVDLQLTCPTGRGSLRITATEAAVNVRSIIEGFPPICGAGRPRK